MNDIKKEAMQIIKQIEKVEVTILGCGKGEGNPCVITDKICQKDARTLATLSIERTIGIVGWLLKNEPKSKILIKELNHQRELLKAVQNL